MSFSLLTLLTFLAGALAVVGAYSILSDLYLRDRARISKRVDQEFRKRQRERIQKSNLFKHLGEVSLEAADDEERPGLQQRLAALVEQAGLQLEPRRLVQIMAVAGLGLGALVGLLLQNVLVGALVVLPGAALPLLYVIAKRKARLEKLMTQLPDAFDLMARVIRSGQTISQAMQSVAEEFKAPVAAEFAYCYEQQNLGLSPELALRDLARRTGLVEIKIFVLALLVQQQTGGNLSELLDRLADVVRQRFRVRGKIRALTAEGRMQSLVLLALPPTLLVIILLINRNYMQILLQYPGLLIGTFISELLGALWIRRIVNFDF